jgi:hypothetical protein
LRTIPGMVGAAVMLIGCASGAPATAGAPEAVASCAFGAFVQESDPAGLNVRAGPGTSHRVLGTLPPGVVDHANGDFVARVELDVLGATADGWFRVARAHDNEALTGQPARAAFAGEGWVSGRKLTVKSQARKGYAKPDAHSEPRLQLGDGESFDNDAMVAAGQLIGCDGKWALVEFADERLPVEVRKALVVAPAARTNLAPGHFRAWVDKICGVQETSCDADAASH